MPSRGSRPAGVFRSRFGVLMTHLLRGEILLLFIGTVFLVWGLIGLALPQLARFIFEKAVHRPRVIPGIRLALGILLLVGAVEGNALRLWWIVLALVNEAAGVLGLLLPVDDYENYLDWLSRRPKLTYRIVGAANAVIGSFILRSILA